MIRESVTTYGIWWGITRVLKWGIIFLWPVLLVYGIATLFGANIDKWSESTTTTLTVITLCISIPVYLVYKRRTSNT